MTKAIEATAKRVDELMGISEFTVKDRLRATIEELIEVAELPKAAMILGRGFFDNFLNNTSDEKITEMLLMMRDELIPLILGNVNDSQDKS